MTQNKVTSLTVDVLDHVEVRHGEDRDRLETGAIGAVVGDVGELFALALGEQAAVHLRPKASIAFSHICSSYVSKNVMPNHLAAYGVRVHEGAVAPEKRRALLGLPDPPRGPVAGPVHEPPVEEGREGQQKQPDLHEHCAEGEKKTSLPSAFV